MRRDIPEKELASVKANTGASMWRPLWRHCGATGPLGHFGLALAGCGRWWRTGRKALCGKDL